MIPEELSRQALNLPPEERIKLARLLIESIEPCNILDAMAEGFRRIEDVVEGRVKALSKEEFRELIQ